MSQVNNECGTRNGFGYYDSQTQEIVLKRPCVKKADLDDVYLWIDQAVALRRISVGIGSADRFIESANGSDLSCSSKEILENVLGKYSSSDSEILHEVMTRITGKEKLRNVIFRCCLFKEDARLFAALLEMIKSLPALVYLDLTGGCFTEEQLVDLADAISQTKAAHVLWPEPKMKPDTIRRVSEKLSQMKTLVVLRGVPEELADIAARNRKEFFELAKTPGEVTIEAARYLRENVDPVLLAIAYEKDRLYELEKVISGVLITVPKK